MKTITQVWMWLECADGERMSKHIFHWIKIFIHSFLKHKSPVKISCTKKWSCSTSSHRFPQSRSLFPQTPNFLSFPPWRTIYAATQTLNFWPSTGMWLTFQELNFSTLRKKLPLLVGPLSTVEFLSALGLHILVYTVTCEFICTTVLQCQDHIVSS